MPIFFWQKVICFSQILCLAVFLSACSSAPEKKSPDSAQSPTKTPLQEEEKTQNQQSQADDDNDSEVLNQKVKSENKPDIENSEPDDIDAQSEEWMDLVERVVISKNQDFSDCPCDPVDIVEIDGEEPTMNDWMIAQRHALADTVHQFGRSVDGWFGKADQRDVELDNETLLKLKLSDTIEERGRNYADFGLRLKLDLPNTEHRFKLILDSDPDDADSLSEKNIIQESAANRPGDQEGTATGGIRFVFDEYRLWRISFDTGVRLSLPLEVFTKFTAKRSGQITENWRVRFKQKVFWYKEDGYGETTEFWFERPLNQDLFLSVKSQIQWLEDIRYFEFSESVTTLHNISESELMRYQVGVVGQAKPNPRTMTSYINVTYRKRLYEDWLFWELTPQVTFPRELDWQDYWSLTAGIEILFMR